MGLSSLRWSMISIGFGNILTASKLKVFPRSSQTFISPLTCISSTFSWLFLNHYLLHKHCLVWELMKVGVWALNHCWNSSCHLFNSYCRIFSCYGYMFCNFHSRLSLLLNSVFREGSRESSKFLSIMPSQKGQLAFHRCFSQ